MKTRIHSIAMLLALCPGLLHGQVTGKLADAKLTYAKEVEELDGALRISAPEQAGQTIAVLEIDKPSVAGSAYALVGDVRYEGMGNGSFLEMWNYLGEDKDSETISNQFFSRTMAPSGLMGMLQGDSDWRRFQLPGYINDGSERKPLKLSLNVHFKDGSTGWVEIRNVDLVDLKMGKSATIPPVVGRSLTITIGIILGAGAVLLFSVWARTQRQRELRRIQAADA